MGRTFGIFLGGNNSEFEGRIVDGIRLASQKYNINNLEFISLMNRPSNNDQDVLSPVIIEGESEIFRLPDFSIFSGIIVIGGSFLNSTVEEKIINKGKAHNIPIAYVGGKRDGCYSISFDDSKGMDSLVEHLISKHKCRRINFISDYSKENSQLDHRLGNYIEVLNRHGISVDEERIGYCEHEQQTVHIIDLFMKKDLPDAVVCANDTLAIDVIDEFISRGYKVPEEIIVTGFDCMTKGQDHFPAITTVGIELEKSGQLAVKALTDHLDGQEPESVLCAESVIITNQSCGCDNSEYFDICKNFNSKNDKLEVYQDFIYDLATMSSEMVAALGLSDLVNIMVKHIEGFGFDEVLFNFCEQIAVQSGDDVEESAQIYRGYSDNMYYMGRDGKGRYRSGSFNISSLVPKMDLNGENPVFYAFIPLYFLDRTLGYVSVTMDSSKKLSNLLYTWVRSVSNAIGEYCMKVERESMVKQLDRMYVRDALTTLYNRRGLQRYAQILMSSAKAFGERIMGIGIDMDDLKKINDNYGHQEGDIAIRAVADAIRKASVNGEICSRTGGDEFFVVGNCDSPDDAQKLIEQIEDNLVVYNEHHNNPYKIGCSCGSYVIESGNDYTLETLMKIADSRMYIVKADRKARRIAESGR